MKFKTLVLTLALVAGVFCEHCTPSADDLVSLLQKEVDSYDQFIYGRYMAANKDTCHRVYDGMSRLRSAFKEEVSVIMGAALRQLKTLEDTARNTDAGPCVDRMVFTLERDIDKEDTRFQQCLDVPAAKMDGLQRNLAQDAKKYADLKYRFEAALKNCLVNFPSSCPNTSTTCMNTQIDYFNTAAKDLTESKVVRSPCMLQFVEALQCFSKSIENVIKKAKTVQKKTTACISFEDNDIVRQSILAFAKNLDVNWTVLEQVESAQKKFEKLNSNVVKTLGRYYELEKSAKMTYEFKPHSWEHFKQQLDKMFATDLSRVEEVRDSKRYIWGESTADRCCGRTAAVLQYIVEKASFLLESCEEKLLKTTLEHIDGVRKKLVSVMEGLSLMGDSTIMECLNNGAILSENAIEGCYDLELRRFVLAKQDALEKVERLMTVLERFNSTYFNVAESTSTLCGNSFLNRTALSVESAMFQLNRCPYKHMILDEGIEYPTTAPDYVDNNEYQTTTPDYYDSVEYEIIITPDYDDNTEYQTPTPDYDDNTEWYYLPRLTDSYEHTTYVYVPDPE